MCFNDSYLKFYNSEFYTGRDPMAVMSDQDFWDWVDGKDLKR